MTQDKRTVRICNGGRVLIRKIRVKKNAEIPCNSKNDSTNNTQSLPGDNLEHFQCITIAHVNINSIRSKVDSISAELANYDIICVSETKLNEAFKTSDLEIDGYKVPIRKDRQVNNGGGLLIYVKNNISFKRRADLESDNIENIWLEINSLRNKFLVGLFYRPPTLLQNIGTILTKMLI